MTKQEHSYIVAEYYTIRMNAVFHDVIENLPGQ